MEGEKRSEDSTLMCLYGVWRGILACIRKNTKRWVRMLVCIYLEKKLDIQASLKSIVIPLHNQGR